MWQTSIRGVIVATLLVLGILCPTALGDEHLLGTWIGTGDENEGERVTLERGAIVADGDRAPLAFPSPGVLLIGPPGDQVRMTYELRGDTLRVNDGEATSTWRRADRRPPPPAEDEPPANPLGGAAQAPAADPFARRFAGDGLELTLEGSIAAGYRGQLTLRGTAYPVQARAAGTTLRGSFTVGQHHFEFRGALENERLTLTSGGKEYRLTGEKPKPNAQVNPLGAGGEDRAQTGPHRDVPAPGTKAVVNREAGLAWRMPEGWQVAQASREGCLINPGFRDGQTLDVAISLHGPPLEPAQRGVAIEKILAQELPDFRQSLRGNGVLTQDPEQPVRLLQAGGGPAAFVTMRGETTQRRPAVVWVAARLDGDTALVCIAIFLDGMEARFLPRVKDVFETLRTAGAADRGNEPPVDARPQDPNDRRPGGLDLPPRDVGGGDPPPSPTGPPGNIVLVKHTLRDPASRNMESHTLLVPKGWTVEGGAWWASTTYFNVLPSRDIRIQAPDGLRIHLAPSVLAKDYLPPPQFGVPRPQEGSADNGIPILYMPGSLDEWSRWLETRGLPKSYPGATNVRVDNAVVVPELTAILRRMMAPLRQMQAQQQPLDASMGLRSFLDANVMAFECRYAHEGRDWEELVILGVTYQGTESAPLGRQVVWSLNPVVTYRAPAGQLEANMPFLVAVANSLRVTPQWAKMRSALQAKLAGIARETARQAHEAAMKRSRMLAQAHREINDIIVGGHRAREAIRDGTHRKVINAIRGTEDYVLPGSSETVQLPNHYQNVYANGNDEYLLTNDNLYDPNTDSNRNTLPWQALKPLR